MKPMAATIMVQGTASDVGKSILTAALCRIFWQDGWKVAPFKSQNMSLNSYVTPDGKEIGRAQGMQADACRIAATTDMNPILLKPKKDMVAQVVVHGKPYQDLEARAYREQYLPKAEAIVKEALARLRARTDVVVLEGAGSPAEVNLKDRDIVNMRMAGWADAPVLLAADIDRGGVFASIVGTMEILTPEERDRVKGFIINKFRGDVSLLKPGLDWLEERTGKPVLGVIPYLPELGLEDEDSASLDAKLQRCKAGLSPDKLDIAVLRLPRLSNFTDIDPLLEEEDVAVRFVATAEEFGHPDAVIIPGSKNTVDDLLYLRASGLEEQIAEHVRRGGFLTGICAGYQMLGERLLDPLLVEAAAAEVAGLGFLPTETTYAADKITERVIGMAAVAEWAVLAAAKSDATIGKRTQGRAVEGEAGAAGRFDSGAEAGGLPVSGYEIHMGVTRFTGSVRQPFSVRLERQPGSPAYAEGAMSEDGKVWGTAIHGILHNDELRRGWLNQLREPKGWTPLPASLRLSSRREAAFDRLADHVRRHLDMGRIYEIVGLPESKK